MAEKPNKLSADSESPASPFDRVEPDEADLWFIPDRPVDARPPASPRSAAPMSELADWARAQDRLSGELADLTRRFGMLQERLAWMGQGAAQRLALIEAADLSWWAGGRVAADRLGLWLGAHLGGAGEDGPDLAQAAWAARRLMTGQVITEQGCSGPASVDLARFLNRRGEMPDMTWMIGESEALHPVTRGALLFHRLRWSGEGPAAPIEAAVAAACHAGAAMGQPGFMPIAMGGGAGLRASGTPVQRLAAWISGAVQAVQTALTVLDRLRLWHGRALAGVAGMSGRTPARLVAVLTAWPHVSAPLAEAQTGASRAAVQRNLDVFHAQGLIREVTGQGRYRVWTAVS